MRTLLMLNWRDPWHPAAGGAELVTLRVLERLQQRGWIVEWFSGAYDGAADDEVRDGIRHVRAGKQGTVHLAAYRRYHRRRFDVIVDQINTIPFMTPLYVNGPRVAFFHQLAREVWRYERGPIVGRVGFAAEPFYLRPYRNETIITVSDSSRQSLRNIGLRGTIFVIPEAVDESPLPEVPEKAASRDIIVLGRVTPSKRIEESIRAVSMLKQSGWRGTLRIVGGGSTKYIERLRRLTATANVADQVFFAGRVSHAQRRDLLKSSSALWMTSVREGWGLVVTEAARLGTPAVVYDVPGLRDSVRDGETGFVTACTPQALAAATQTLFSRFAGFSARALSTSLEYDWGKTAEAFETALLWQIKASELRIGSSSSGPSTCQL